MMLSPMLSLKRFLKNRMGRHYHPFRSKVIGLILRWRALKVRSFQSAQLRPFRYRGISFQIMLDPKNGFVDEEIYFKKVYETDILDVYLKQLHQGDTFVDIGANIGEHSLFASRIVGERGSVIAFEPIESLRTQFSESVAANDIMNIVIIPHACGSEKLRLPIHKQKGNAGASSLIGCSTHAEGDIETVSVIPADDILSELGRVDVIKIDAEGYEYQVLLGLKETLSKFQPRLLIEYSPILYGASNSKDAHNGVKLIELLTRLGYEIEDLEFRSDTSDPIAWSRSFAKDQTNIWCTVKKRASNLESPKRVLESVSAESGR